MAARGGGRLDSRGQGPCRSALTREAPIFVHRRAAMISPQRHRDRRDNSQLISGDGRAPAPCPPCLGDEDLCETNPICRRRAGKTIVKAKGLGDATPQGGNDAKRSQFGKSLKFDVSSVKQEKPMVESSNFTLYTSHELPLRTNKANLRRTGYPIIPVFHQSTIPVRCRLCKTNPIPGGPPNRGIAGGTPEG
jgi:hypothetical protein